MPIMDDSFQAFVTNLGKYNEGELVGEWVKFPTTEEEMQKVFERIGIGSKDEFGHVYEEWFITDYECPIYGVQKLLGEYESLDKLNYLASRIDEMDKWDQEKFVAIMEAGCDEVSDIDDLINLTYNLDCYDFLPDVTDEEDLGRYYIEEAGIYDTKAMGNLANYIDFERFGRDVAMDEGGRFTDDGYIRNTGDGWTRMFDGSLDDIPDEYRLTGGGEEPMKDGNILAVVVEPGKKPEIKEIDSSLEGLQALVGGYIQAVYPYEDPVGIVCNEEAKLEGLPLNRALRDADGEIYDIVAGTFAIVGLTDDSFGSLDGELALIFPTKDLIRKLLADLMGKLRRHFSDIKRLDDMTGNDFDGIHSLLLGNLTSPLKFLSCCIGGAAIRRDEHFIVGLFRVHDVRESLTQSSSDCFDFSNCHTSSNFPFSSTTSS